MSAEATHHIRVPGTFCCNPSELGISSHCTCAVRTPSGADRKHFSQRKAIQNVLPASEANNYNIDGCLLANTHVHHFFMAHLPAIIYGSICNYISIIPLIIPWNNIYPMTTSYPTHLIKVICPVAIVDVFSLLRIVPHLGEVQKTPPVLSWQSWV